MKTCKRCGIEKAEESFLRDKRASDGLFSSCKECTYSMAKIADEKRKALKPQKTRRSSGLKRTAAMREYDRAYKLNNPQKAKAHNMIAKRIKSGKIVTMPCEVCGNSEYTVAHHDDYSKPLDIRWLCELHHKEWHKINGEGLNG